MLQKRLQVGILTESRVGRQRQALGDTWNTAQPEVRLQIVEQFDRRGRVLGPQPETEMGDVVGGLGHWQHGLHVKGFAGLQVNPPAQIRGPFDTLEHRLLVRPGTDQVIPLATSADRPALVTFLPPEPTA